MILKLKFRKRPAKKLKSLRNETVTFELSYSHLFNKRGGWNKREGGAKVAKSLNVEVGIFLKSQ